MPAALLVVVALGQLALAHTTGLSPWKGGGFGMFASLDARPFRYVRVFVEAPERSEELAIPASLEALAASAEILPGDRQLERLARGVVARERRHQRPVVNGRIEVWRAEYAPGVARAAGCACCARTPSMRLRSWVVPHGPTDAIDIALRLTLIVLLLRPMGPWYVAAFVLLLAVVGLISVPAQRAPATWLVLAALIATHLVVDWPLPDNHLYLLAYWCLGVGIALRLGDPSRALARTGRQLLGLVFVFAVVWKAALSPDYRDGRFFAVTLLTDERFADAVQLVGGLSRSAAEGKPRVPAAPAGGRRVAGAAAHSTRRRASGGWFGPPPGAGSCWNPASRCSGWRRSGDPRCCSCGTASCSRSAWPRMRSRLSRDSGGSCW